MIALIIVLFVVLLCVLLCLVKLEFFAQYSDSLTLKLRVLFVTFTLVPSKKKPKKAKAKKVKKKKKKTEEQKQSYVKKLSDKKGVSGIVSMIAELAKLAGTTLKGVISHTVIRKFDIRINVVGDDAADTALKYGKICSVFYPAVTIVCESAMCKDYFLDVTPDFSDDAVSKVYGDFRFDIRVFYVLKYALKALYKLLLIRYKR